MEKRLRIDLKDMMTIFKLQKKISKQKQKLFRELFAFNTKLKDKKINDNIFFDIEQTYNKKSVF